MDFSTRAPVVKDELRGFIQMHAELETMISAESQQRVPDQRTITCLKKQKLQLKDKMQRALAALPHSEFRPVDAKLFAMTDKELSSEHAKRSRALRRREQHVDPTSSELVQLRAAVAEVQFEIDRRELEALFSDEKVAA